MVSLNVSNLPDAVGGPILKRVEFISVAAVGWKKSNLGCRGAGPERRPLMGQRVGQQEVGVMAGRIQSPPLEAQ
jgi:hypothetical protein